MTFCGVGMDFFWNCRIDLCHSEANDVEFQENKKLCFCMASFALKYSRLGEACCAKAKLFYSPQTQQGPA